MINISDESLEKNQKNIQTENQIGMALPASKGENWRKIKKRLEKVEKKFELTPFWKYGLNIFFLITILFLGAVLAFGFFSFFEKLPAEIPLVYNQRDQIWEVYPSYSLVIIGMVFFLVEMAIFILSYHIYFFDKRLSIVINLISIIAIYIFILGLAQILSFELL